MAVPAGGRNNLRAALQAKRWSYSRLAVELRRRGDRDAVTLPKHESLVTLITRWANNRQQPDGFYRDLLSRTFGLLESELFEDAAQVADLAAGAEPWLLARALDASTVGARSLDLLEAAVADFARRYPSAAPADLLGPVREHYQDAVRLLASPLRVAHRRRLSAVAGVLAGLAGSLSFDLKDQTRAAAYFEVAQQAAEEDEDRDLAAWALATWSLMPTYHGDPAEALRLIHAVQAAGGRALSPTRGAWLAALEAKAHAGLGDSPAKRRHSGPRRTCALAARVGQEPAGNRLLRRPSSHGLRGHVVAAAAPAPGGPPRLTDVLALRSATDVKGRSLARLDLAAVDLQEREVEKACAAIAEALSIPAAHRVHPIRRRAREILADLAPWNDHPAVRDLREQTRHILTS